VSVIDWCWFDLLYAGCDRCGERRRIGNLLYKGDADTFAARRTFEREHSFCQPPRRPQEAYALP